jgi:hypothetical protein
MENAMKPTDETAFAALLAQTWMAYNQVPQTGLVEIFFKELADYELSPIAAALKVHLHDPEDGRFPPTIASLMKRLPKKHDGRPEGHVVWTLLPFLESQSAFLPEEAITAFWNQVYPAIEAGKSPETAKPFFLKDYDRLVAQSRNQGLPLKVVVTLGHRGEQEHIRALRAAVEAGAVPIEWAQRWMQVALPGHPAVDLLPAPEKKALTHAD